MTKREILLTRIRLAQSISRSPDSIDVHDFDNGVLYLINDFSGMNFAISFDKVPTIDEAREEVKNYYLNGCEAEFDFEFGNIKPPK